MQHIFTKEAIQAKHNLKRGNGLKFCLKNSNGSQCWYFSHEPSSLFHHSVLVDLNVSVMMH